MNNGCTAIGSVIVLENTQSPIVTVLATNYVLDSTNPTSDITASSSTFSEYEWSTGETTTSITVSAAGVYTVTVTDMNNGCFTIEEVTITDAAVDCTNSNIQVTIVPQGAEEFTCDNGSVMVVAEVIPAGTYTYEWSQMISTTETNTYFSAGTHFVTVTDTDGCTGVGFIDIFEDLEVPIMELFPLGELDCTNDEVIINADILNWEIFTNYDYQWTGSDIISGNGTPSITVGEAGVYEVTLTNLENACSSTESITITSNEIPPTVNISVSNYILDDTNPTAILTATGNPFFGTYTYEWSTGETTEDITVISGGVYTVEITDVNNGCVTVESITITENFTNPPT
ncbi:MAG: hypothetical protein ACPG5P_09180, partial [Saprospiraceae bacterium]